jgi:DNA-binding MarR family transcriptional regulator
MRKKMADKISENALLLFPLWKCIFSGDPSDPALVSLKNQTYQLLRILEMRGPLPLSAMGKQLFIAKQNMTTFIDKLMKEGMVERMSDVVDRRVVNIIITDKGKGLLKESRQGLNRIVYENLSKLSDEDVKSLYSVFEMIKTIIHKLES